LGSLHTRLLNEEERQLAINRLLADNPAAVTTRESTKLKLIARSINPIVRSSRSPVSITTHVMQSMACTGGFAAGNVVVQGVAVFLPSIIQVRRQR
jgi:hypothetical protein